MMTQQTYSPILNEIMSKPERPNIRKASRNYVVVDNNGIEVGKASELSYEKKPIPRTLKGLSIAFIGLGAMLTATGLVDSIYNVLDKSSPEGSLIKTAVGLGAVCIGTGILGIEGIKRLKELLADYRGPNKDGQQLLDDLKNMNQLDPSSPDYLSLQFSKELYERVNFNHSNRLFNNRLANLLAAHRNSVRSNINLQDTSRFKDETRTSEKVALGNLVDYLGRAQKGYVIGMSDDLRNNSYLTDFVDNTRESIASKPNISIDSVQMLQENIPAFNYRRPGGR